MTKQLTYPPTAPLGYSVNQAAAAAGVGRTTIYEEIRAGEIAICKIGDRTIIEVSELKRWLRSKRRNGSAG
jgi:excisionase family DNA binding protein